MMMGGETGVSPSHLDPREVPGVVANYGARHGCGVQRAEAPAGVREHGAGRQRAKAPALAPLQQRGVAGDLRR